jgi:hypothetical protein
MTDESARQRAAELGDAWFAAADRVARELAADECADECLVTAPGRAQALAALDSLPDSAMALFVWWRDENGDLVRPCTREEIRDGLLSGSVGPDAVLSMAPIAQQAYDSVAESEALERRRSMRAV